METEHAVPFSVGVGISSKVVKTSCVFSLTLNVLEAVKVCVLLCLILFEHVMGFLFWCKLFGI